MVTNFPKQVVGDASEGKREGGGEAYFASSQQEVQTSTLLYNFLEIGYMAAFYHTGALDFYGKKRHWTISHGSAGLDH